MHRTKMKIVSLSFGLLARVIWHGHTVTTGIFKQPVKGRLHSANSTSTATVKPT